VQTDSPGAASIDAPDIHNLRYRFLHLATFKFDSLDGIFVNSMSVKALQIPCFCRLHLL